MLRKVAIWVLLVPLPFNGLWMVCGDPPPIGSEASVLSEYSDFAVVAAALESFENEAECAILCPLKQPAKEGSFCFLSADGDNGSITIFVFGLALVPAAASVHPSVAVEAFLPGPLDSYLNASGVPTTPPPRV